MGLLQYGNPCKPQQQQRRQQHMLGGTRAALFVYAMQGLENMAFIANAVSLVTYFIGYMNFGLAKSATTVTNFSGTSFLLSLFGGFISDTYLTRFNTCVIFGCIEIVGYVLLTIQAHLHSLRPEPCKGGAAQGSCQAATDGQLALLYTGLYLVAFGTSGVKAALPPLGADQFDEKDPVERAHLSSFFNWFLFSLTVGASIGVTFVVWISTDQGWDWGFGLCVILVLFSVIFVSMGRSFYRNNSPGGSALTRILQVFVVTVRNWNLPVPSPTDELHENYIDKESGNTATEIELLQRTGQFKFLDRAAIPKPTTSSPWKMCTITQIEETKLILRMLPIILTTIFLNVCLAQLQTFSIQQATTMDTHFISNFHIPPASIPVVPLLSMVIIVPIYDRVFVPLARRFTGISTGIRPLQRIGVGLLLSATSMAVAGLVERKRKSVAIHHNMVDSMSPLPITVFWLGLQYVIFGAADIFTLVGLLEFFYAESSTRMKSLSTAISWCSMGLGYFGSSVLVEVVNKASGGWLRSNNLNRDRLEYFYWLLAGLSVVNFGLYLVCASWYRYKQVDFKSSRDVKLEVTST